jgi:spermidine synthase
MELNGDSGAIHRGVAAAGAASLLAQVVLLREILASSQGNELVLGLVLALWLLLTGVASAAGARLASGRVRATQWFGLLLCAAPAFLIASLWLTQFTRPESPLAGQDPGILAVLLASLAALTPACCLGGLAFALASTAAAKEGAVHAATIYVAETVGAAVAGLLFHFLFAEKLPSAWILCLAAAVCVVAGANLLFPRRSKVVIAGGLLVVVLALPISPRLTALLASARFRGEQVIAMQPSRYGLLAVVARGGQRAFFHDGVLLFTTEDEIAAEESIHLPMLLHPHPSRVLLVGGGLGGGLVEVLKHRPAQIDYVEMDPDIFRLARAFADEKTRAALADSRVHAITADGRSLLRESVHRYDVILVDLPVPQNALMARFSSRECFQDARRALAPGGILALTTPGSDAYLDGPARQRHAALVATLGASFPEIGVAPGSQTILWGSEQSVDTSPALLAGRLNERGLHLVQVGRAWLRNRVLPLHVEEYRRDLAEAAPILNRDFRPVVYLFGLIENLERLSPTLGRAALTFVRAPWATWLVVVGVLGVAAPVLIFRRGKGAPGFAAAIAGAAGMGLQIVLLLAFQALQGHLYHALGGLLAAFMAGMASGALAGRRYCGRSRALAGACAVAALIAGLVPAALYLAQAAPSLGRYLTIALTVLVGVATGAVYPLAVDRVATSRRGTSAAARIYAWDLAGAACAAALTALVAIPLLGLVPVAFLAAALCGAATLANLASSPR